MQGIDILAIGGAPLFADLLSQVDNTLAPGNVNTANGVFPFNEVSKLDFGHQNVENRMRHFGNLVGGHALSYNKTQQRKTIYDVRHVHCCDNSACENPREKVKKRAKES